MSRSDIISYTGVGEPPFCKMTLRAFLSQTTPPDLQFTVTLDGFQTPKNELQLDMKAEVPPEVNAKCGQLCNVTCFFIVTCKLLPTFS